MPEYQTQFNQEFYQDVLNSLTVPVLVLAQDGTITAVNEAWQQFATKNYAPNSGAVGANYFDVVKVIADVSAGHAAEIEAGLRAVSDGQLARFEKECACRASDQGYWFLVRAAPFKGRAGEIVVSHTNIGRLKQAELAQQESESRFRSLAENSPDIIYILDLNISKAIYFNRTELLGYRATELEQPGSVFAAVHPNDTARVANHWQMVKQGQAGEIEYRFQAKDGRWEWLQSRETPLTYNDDGSSAQVLVTLTVITERKRVENELRQSQNLFQQVIASISDHIYVTAVDAAGGKTNIYLSPNMKEITGYAAADFVEDWELWPTTLIYPADRGVAAAQAQKLVAGQSSETEYRMVRADHEVIWVRDSARVVTEASGRRLIYGVISDITARKQAEQNLQQRNRELEFLNRVGQALVSTLDLEAMLAAVLEETRQLLAVFGCSAWLLNPNSGKLVCLQAADPYRELLHGWELDPAQGLVGWAAHHGQSLLTADTRTDPRHYPEIAQLIGVETRSILSVPLRVKDKIIGALNVVDIAANRFTLTDLSLLESVAATLAIAIENTRLFDQEQQQRQAAEQALQETQLLHRISSILAQTSNMQAAVAQVLGEYLAALKLEQGGITLFDPAEQTGILYALYRRGQPQSHSLPIKIASPVYRELIETQQPVFIADAATDPRLANNQELTKLYQIKSILFVPLRVQGQVVGALGADSTDQPRHFTAREISLGQAVAAQLAGAIERIRLDEDHRRLSAVVEQAAETIIITDPPGNIVYANPHFETSSGYSVTEALGQNPNLVQSGRQNTAFYEELWAVISAGRVWHGRFVNRRKDGRLYHEEASIFPIKNSAGEIINYAAVKRDITERLQVEEQLRHSQKIEAIGRLAGGVAHDFNNILTVIIGYAEFLLLQHPAEDGPLYQDITGIIRAAERAAGLTRQLLAFSRRQLLHPQRLEMNDLVVNLQKMLGRLLSKNIELKTRLAPRLEPIYADRGQIEQVIVNLVVNARDAMPDGGVITLETDSVYLETAAGLVNSKEFEPGPYLRLTVSDTGAGIAAADLERIFEPFFTTKAVGQGTGLGLSMVHGIVSQSQGYIKVDSQAGQGARFSLYLPQAKSARLPDTSKETAPLQPGRETVLLVEDEAEVRSVATQALEKYGYSVLVAANGEDAYLLTRQYQGTIHLLLTNMVLTGSLTGITLAQMIAVERPHVKTVFMSGNTREFDLLPDPILPDTLLQKPFTPAGLIASVQAALAAGDSRQ